jgi:hypothetical protein
VLTRVPGDAQPASNAAANAKHAPLRTDFSLFMLTTPFSENADMRFPKATALEIPLGAI